ncbi:MAG TPA: S-ribosylhomocysteine lyase [Treponemataceae bacterium]|nr:S-ribosylhomocysteine lyase [Treponemataceae bacterium]HQL04308.1 S-ribosylhomocysteine lyase [Treponemataceae bacterium]
MEKTTYKVESFNLDHTKVTAPYVRTASTKTGPKGDVVSKFDIRFTQPNKETMSTAGIHTIEHLVAEYIRDELDGIIDFSPMGCRTGFYLTVFGELSGALSEALIAEKMLIVLRKVASWPDDKKVPGLDPKECGNYQEHNLSDAKFWAQKWVTGIEQKGFSCYQ